ncbi:MaoC family dehydratase [Phreatobacter aquaticus]|uniref:MaoC family dehydratase n=1 Tax=Phreatobacter aquaticus TaxID=2570229 RepID=A0A4D7QFJ0_9HYPH|nr:MaoC family dehydratase [Phreatobacter aquaticus]QCK85938.1 MaoC family dehydratase [Phreatobacter aquaticus]
MTEQIWFEDFVPGTVLRSPERLITLDDIDRYADLTGERHPVHMDEAFAKRAGFPGRIAHGLFGLALIEGLKAEIGCFEESVVASLGWDKVRFHAPLAPGDLVHLELELVDKRPSSKPGRGIATERGVLVRSDGTKITSGDHVIVLLNRPE